MFAKHLSALKVECPVEQASFYALIMTFYTCLKYMGQYCHFYFCGMMIDNIYAKNVNTNFLVAQVHSQSLNNMRVMLVILNLNFPKSY